MATRRGSLVSAGSAAANNRMTASCAVRRKRRISMRRTPKLPRNHSTVREAGRRGAASMCHARVGLREDGYLKVAATGEVAYSVGQFAGDSAALSVKGRT